MQSVIGGYFGRVFQCFVVVLLAQSVLAADEPAKATKPAKSATVEKQISRQVQPAPAPVPVQQADVILGQPTASSVVFSILRYDQDASAVLKFVNAASEQSHQLEVPDLKKDQPLEVTLNGLAINSQYNYALLDSQTNAELASGSFHTQRAAGSSFTFTITADSHLDKNADVPLYLQTLANTQLDKPDFHIDLGDTFMSGKHANRDNAFAQYLAQRYYFGQLSAPLFLVVGNHDGEEAKQRKGGMNSLAVWSAQMRTRYFPNPQPSDFYSGNDEREEGIGYLEDYYSWRWGDAEFFVLNPYWQSFTNKDSGRWALSLGDTQYKWLRDGLAASQAKYKFVFVHQMIGGLDRNGRGGIEGVPFGEWGGKSANGDDDFAEQRPGWDEPIHSLLVKHGVNAVFHGHDHLFATEQLDGIVYQLVPQPAHLSFAPPRDAKAYGYTSGTVLGGSGHMRVMVSPEGVTVEFVRADIERQERESSNREVLHRYTIE
jgi:predicted phosphodiesterase